LLFKKPSTIRFKLTCLVIFSVVPVWLIAAFLVSQAYLAKHSEVSVTMLNGARSLAMLVDQDLTNIQAALLGLATSPSFTAGDFANVQRQAMQLLESYPDADIIVADASGQQIVNSFRPFGDPLPKRKNQGTVRRVFTTEKPVVSDLFYGALTKRPLISVDVPVLVGGKVKYDLAMTFPADRLTSVLLKQSLPAGQYASICDNNMIVVTRSRFPEKFAGKPATPVLKKAVSAAREGTFDSINLEGKPVYLSFSRSATSGWTVLIGVPKAVGYAEVYRWMGWALSGAAVISLFGIALAAGYARRIAQAIQALVAPALSIGRGEPVVITGNNAIKETGEVASALLQASLLLKTSNGELRESERRYSALFANKLNGIAHCRVITDEQSTPVDYLILRVNEAYQRIIGMKKAQLEGRRARDVFPGLETFSFDYIGVLGKIALEGGEISFESFLEPTGQHLSVYAYSPLEGEFAVILSDVTEQKQVEEARAKLAAIVKSADDAIISIDLNGVILDWNQGAERLLGFSAGEVVDRPLALLLPPESQGERRVLQRLQSLLAGEKVDNFQSVWLSKPGRRIDVSVSISPIIHEGLIVGASKIVRDITRHTQLAAYKELDREVLQVLSGTADFHDLIRQVLSLLKEHTGFAAVAIRLQDRDDFPYYEQHGLTREFLLAENSLLQQSAGEPCRSDCGTKVPECICGLVISGKAGPADAHFTPGGSFWSNDLASLLEVGLSGEPGFHQRTGCLRQGYASSVLVPIRNNGSIQGLIQLSDSGKERLSIEMVEMLEGIAAQIGAALVRKQAEAVKIQLEEQLQHAQKMESVGRLAGGVAHDFNNMLGVILGHANLALMDLDPTQALYGSLTEIHQAAERSASLTRQLLAFARKQTIVPRTIDLNETLAGMLNMLRRIIGEGIDLSWQPDEDVWPVKVDSSQLDQILANLCVNARDAIADVGKVTIETGNSTIDEAYCSQYKGILPGEYVRLTVSDTGCGMDKDTLNLIFEPFFTTKGTGKGTGLGLATVYGAVKQNNGFIYVNSLPGLGTTFSVFLPRHQGDAPAPKPGALERQAESGHETILLVEDEPAILNVTTLILTRQGYTVLAADSPEGGIALGRENAGRISLLLTDVVMPRMNGRDLARELLSSDPRLKCLFMSGFTADIIASQGAIGEGVHFIQKPFSVHSLSAKVREVLDSGKGS
jgi:PAS domain S-box-containing protein